MGLNGSDPAGVKKRRGDVSHIKKYQYKKGQSGNPRGPIANPVTKALKKLTIESFREAIELALSSNLAALRDLARHPETPAVQVGIAVAFLKAIEKGDWSIMEAITARIVGKIPDKLEVTSDNTHTLSVVNQTKIAEAMAKLESDV